MIFYIFLSPPHVSAAGIFFRKYAGDTLRGTLLREFPPSGVLYEKIPVFTEQKRKWRTENPF